MSCESIVAFAGCVHYCYIKSRALRVSINFDIGEHVYIICRSTLARNLNRVALFHLLHIHFDQSIQNQLQL